MTAAAGNGRTRCVRASAKRRCGRLAQPALTRAAMVFAALGRLDQLVVAAR